ncbi:M12 family metallo-peptidase [Pseudomonas sp. R37(2017)]|uniref:PKD domain-containing protein n=1 Tax=Pseudomonas sp. R37(2017) TaxID=1981685 RepID=UPI001302B4BA|nr:M12 family metallo-peptidase [Pseudomonas sp. R37(2017)]
MRTSNLAAFRLLWIITLLVLSFSVPGFAQADPANVRALLSLEQTSAKAALSRNANPYLKRLIDDSQSEVITLARGHGQVVLDEQQWLEIPLEPGVTVRARKLHYTTESGMGVWVGEVQSDDLRQRRGQAKADLSREVVVDPQNLVVLVRNGERITGTVSAGGRQYQIEPVDKGQVAITRIKPSDNGKDQDDSPAEVMKQTLTKSGQTARHTSQQPIRILTVYSNDVKNAYADPVALGVQRFEYFKEIARASGVTVTYVNAGVEHLPYDESSFPGCDQLDCMNKQLAEVRRNSESLQVQLKAHVVMGVVAKKLTSRGCGLAGSVGADSVSHSVGYACAGERGTYAHELGHVIGAHHSGMTTPFAYSSAFCQGSVEPKWQTIMAYCDSNGRVIDLFSNPERTYEGIPMGVADRHDNARSINNWYPTLVGLFPPPDNSAPPIASGFVELGQKELPFSTESATLNGAASRNPGSDALRYEWTQTAGVPAVTIDDSQAKKATANFPEVTVPTDYRFRLTVANATGQVDATEVGVRVYPRDIGAACENSAAWDPDRTYSIVGEQVSYQGSLYRLLTQPSGSFARRPPVVWSGLIAPMNWALVKTCDAPRTLEQRLATMDAWAQANGAIPVTTGLQEQLRNLLAQQQFTWPAAEAAGRLRPIAFESKNCVVSDPANPNRLVLQQACNEERAGRWLLDGSGRLHNMDDPGLCLQNNGNNQRVTLAACTDASTPWIRLKDDVSDYQTISGQSLLSNFTLHGTVNYGDYLADDGHQNLIVKTRTPTNSIRYATFGNVPHDSSLLLAHAKAQTLTAIGRVLDGEGVPGTAPPMPPQIIVSGPSTAVALESVLLDASQSSSINPGASDLQYTWQVPPGISAQANGAQLRFTAPNVSSATPFTFNLTVSDGQAQAQAQHTVTVTRQGHSDPEGELSLPAQVLEKTAVTFTANVRSPGDFPLTYAWQRPTGFTGTVGNTPSVTLTAPAVAADTPVAVEVTVTDSEGGALTLRGTVLVKKDTQMTGGRIDGPVEVNSEEQFTQTAYVHNPQNRPLTYAWTVTSPTKGELEIIGPDNQREIHLKAPRILTPNIQGYVRVVIRDGVSLVSLPNKTIKINPQVLPPLEGRLIMPSMVNVGDVFVPRVVLDNPEGRDISYSWIVNQGYFEILSSDPGQPTAQIRATRSSNNGGVLVQATVADGTGRNTVYNEPRVIVYEPKGNNPPQGQIEGPLEVASGQSVSYRAGFSSPVGNPLSYAWAKGSLIGATPNSAEQTWTAPVVTTDQVITVRVTVTDNAGNANSHAIAVVIKAPGDNPPPQPPVGQIISDDTVESGAQVLFSTDATSTPPGDKLTYDWSAPSGFTGTIGDRPSGTLTAPVINSDTFSTVQLTVTDSKNARHVMRKTLTVKAQVPAPVARISGAERIEAGKSAVWSASGSTGSGLRYAWKTIGFTPATSTQVSPTFTAPATSGVAGILELTVTSTTGATATTVKTVSVLPPEQAGDCAPPWIASKVYAVENEQVSYDGYNYEVAHWTQNQRPDLNWVIIGNAKPWRRLQTCSP